MSQQSAKIFGDPALLNPFRETPATVVTVKAPWYESIPIGTPAGDGQTTNLTQGYVYLRYSSPLPDPIELHAININFTAVDVRVLLANQVEKHSWSPFIHVPIFAVAGIFSQAEPNLRLPRPIKIEPFSRIQIAVVNWSTTIENCVITLVGIREVEQLVCF